MYICIYSLPWRLLFKKGMFQTGGSSDQTRLNKNLKEEQQAPSDYNSSGPGRTLGPWASSKEAATIQTAASACPKSEVSLCCYGKPSAGSYECGQPTTGYFGV